MSAISLAADLVRQFEGCQLTAYADLTGVMTIGVGHTGPDVHEGLTWTQGQADSALAADLRDAQDGLDWLVKDRLSDKQAAALISLAFNVGARALRDSKLIDAINAGHWADAVREWIRWDHAGKQEVKGLLRRRLVEAALYLEGT